MQIPIGSENNFEGVIDIIGNKELHFELEDGKPVVIEREVRESLLKMLKFLKKG